MCYHQDMSDSLKDWGLQGDNAESLAATLNKYVQRLTSASPSEKSAAGEALMRKYSTMLACSSCQEAGIASPQILELIRKTLAQSQCSQKDIALWESKWIQK